MFLKIHVAISIKVGGKMNFNEKLKTLRAQHKITQEELSQALGISRQAVARWESAQAFPDIQNLCELSRIFSVSIDYLVKNGECEKKLVHAKTSEMRELALFRMEAAKNTYAAASGQCESSRPESHDFRFEENGWLYIDTYLGGEKFSGEEAVWKSGSPLWAMNYSGRVLNENFSGDFLKSALRNCTEQFPRGPRHFSAGEFLYKTEIQGEMEWFQGFEEIFFRDEKCYECHYHGGVVK